MQSEVNPEGKDSEWHEGPEIGPRDCRWHGKLWCSQWRIKSRRAEEFDGERSKGHHVLTAPKCQHTYTFVIKK